MIITTMVVLLQALQAVGLVADVEALCLPILPHAVEVADVEADVEVIMDTVIMDIMVMDITAIVTEAKVTGAAITDMSMTVVTNLTLPVCHHSLASLVSMDSAGLHLLMTRATL